MDNKLQGLPPLKRFRLLHQVNDSHHLQPKNADSNIPATPCLPAKKRKQSVSPPSLLLSPPPIASSFCLPAKKRIWALQPFDLNVSVEDDLPEPGKSTDISNPSDNFRVEEANIVDEDDGIVCAVCDSTDGDPRDPIVLCDGCDLMVHCTCYGHPLVKGVPEGDWFCAQCLASNPKVANPISTNTEASACCLCPVTGGALKTTNDGRWAHLVCALFVPEVFFNDPEARQGINCSKVPRRRWEQRCYLCKSKHGCVIDCSEPKCHLSFHVTCGLNEDLYIEYQAGKKKSDVVAAFCRKHSDLWQKQQRTGKFKIVARD